MEKETKRNKLLRKAKQCLSHIPISFPSDGICPHCSEDLIERYAYRLNQEAGILITGCPNCHRSYCD